MKMKAMLATRTSEIICRFGVFKHKNLLTQCSLSDWSIELSVLSCEGAGRKTEGGPKTTTEL